jgi:uncharacterized protein (TIGR03000 family)
MFQKRYSIVLTATVALAALLLTVAPASAARYGNSQGGYNGGYNRGYNGGYNRGYNGGYNRGYNGGNYGYGNYGWNRSGVSIGFGGYDRSFANPSYGYYSSPNVQYVTPSYYYTPSTTFVTPTPPPPPVVSQAAFTQPDDRAHIEVRVPATDAEIIFDGDRTQQQGMDRQFVSPPLTPGKSFSYSIEARWTENGRTMTQKRSVTVGAGQNAMVDFTR